MIFHCAIKFICHKHCVKSVCIRSYSGPYFPAYGPNTERYGVSLRIHSECGKIWTRITPNTDTFYAVLIGIFKCFRSIMRNRNKELISLSLNLKFSSYLHILSIQLKKRAQEISCKLSMRIMSMVYT